MELTKINLLNFQVITTPIQRNFQLIEKEFVTIHQILSQLKVQNSSFSVELAKCFSNIDNLALKKTQQLNSIGDFLIQCQNTSITQIKKTTSETVNFQNKTIKKSNENSNLNESDKLYQVQSQKIFSSQILKEITNTEQQKISKASISLEERHAQLIRSKTKKLSIFNINNQKQQQKCKGKDDLSFIQNKLRIFQANLLEQISELNKQIMEFKQTQSVFKTKFDILQRQNQTFKKLLGIKKKNTNVPQKKQSDKSQQNFQKSKKILESKSKISLKTINQNQIAKPSQRKINMTQSNSSSYEDDEQQNGILSLNKEIQKIRDYLNGKMKAIDQNFNIVNINIQSIERNMQILQRTDNDMKQDIQALQQTCNQTKLNIGQINQKTMIKSRFRSNDILRDQNGKNRQDGQEPLQIQDRIIQLLDEMEKLKSQYSALFQKRQDGNNENQQVNQQIIEKRKKLALKLNPNSAVDQKTKKQLTSVKRDLRRLREQFDLLMNGVNTGSHETKTLIIKPNQTKQDWKSLTTKIYKTRQQLLSIIKDLQTKIVANNDLTVVLNEMEVGIGECKILLKKKVDIVEFQKTTKRIQSRLNNFIKQTFQKEGYTNEQDAMITKQPWFCLSCDIELKTYTGKINRGQGNQSPNQKPAGKKVNPQSHMVRRNQNGRLPSLAL